MSFSLDQLPYFTLWKNTAAEADGYVTGLEPATNLPNFKSFEREQNRVMTLGPQQSYETRLEIEIHDSAEKVQAATARIEKLQNGQTTRVHDGPQPGLSPS